jgi:hypothetical protein
MAKFGIMNQAIIIWEIIKDIENMKSCMKKTKIKNTNNYDLVEKYKLDTWAFIAFFIIMGLIALW